jgi:predicted NACHT family NTPase
MPLAQGLAAVVAVATGVASAVIALVRWLGRTRSSAANEPGIVEFSGRPREAFLGRVWSQRIVNGLERSLQHAAEMRLDLQNAPELIKLTYVQSTAAPGEHLSIEDAYRQAGCQLAILGAPGSGKTTEALKLMRGLLREARLDEEAPVPDIVPLSTWAKERKPILEWLADQIRTRHGRPLSEARSLVWHHRLTPVLDGLDEVALEHRAECVVAINRFWEDHRGGPLVLCCRQTEYEALPEQVKLDE